MAAESGPGKPQIFSVEVAWHTAQFGWIDDESGYMRFEPPIYPNKDRLQETLANGAARLSSKEGDEVEVLDEFEPIISTIDCGEAGDGGSLFWMRVDPEKSPDTTQAERNERATNVAKILIAHAAAAVSAEDFRKLF